MISFKMFFFILLVFSHTNTASAKRLKKIKTYIPLDSSSEVDVKEDILSYNFLSKHFADWSNRFRIYNSLFQNECNKVHEFSVKKVDAKHLRMNKCFKFKIKMSSHFYQMLICKKGEPSFRIYNRSKTEFLDPQGHCASIQNIISAAVKSLIN